MIFRHFHHSSVTYIHILLQTTETWKRKGKGDLKLNFQAWIFFTHKKKTKTVHPTEPGYSWSQQGAPGMDFFHRACFKWKSLTGPVLPLWVSGWLRVLPCLGWNAWLESPEPFGNRHHARDDPRPLRNHLASGQQKQHLWHKSSQHLQAAPCTRRKPTKNRTIRDCDWNVWLFTAKC